MCKILPTYRNSVNILYCSQCTMHVPVLLSRTVIAIIAILYSLSPLKLPRLVGKKSKICRDDNLCITLAPLWLLFTFLYEIRFKNSLIGF